MRVGVTQLLNTILHLVKWQSRVTQSRRRRPLTAKFEQVRKVTLKVTVHYDHYCDFRYAG